MLNDMNFQGRKCMDNFWDFFFDFTDYIVISPIIVM